MKGLHQVLPLVALAANLAIGIYVLTRDPQRLVNRLFAGITFCFGLWNIGEFITQVATGPSNALLGARLASVGWCLLGAVFIHFCLELTGLLPGGRRRTLLAVLYGSGALLLAFTCFTSLVFKGFEPLGQYWKEVEGPLRLFSKLYVVVLMAAGLVILFRSWRTTRIVAKRTQVGYVLIAGTVTYIIGSISDFILPLFNRYSPVSSATITPVMLAIVAYAVTRHNLMTTMATAFADAIVSNMNDAVLVSDADDRVETVNPAALELTGYSAEELTGKPVGSVLVSSNPGTEAGDHVESGVRVDRPFFCLTSGGEVVPVAVGEGPVTKHSGKKIGTVYVLHDIRDALRRASAEQQARLADVKARAAQDRVNALTQTSDELREEKRFLEDVIDNIAEPMFIKDRRLRYVLVNRAFATMMGMDKSDLVGKADRDLFPVDQQERARASDQEVLRTGRYYEEDIVLTSGSSDDTYVFRIRKAPLCDEEGDTEYILGIINDITRQKELERLRLDFIRTAAHELRTPLTSLKLGLDMLGKESRGTLDREQQRSLDVLSLSVQRLTSLARDLLDLANMDAGLMILDRQAVDARPLLQEALVVFENQAREKGLECILDIPETPCVVLADPNRLSQVLHNLVSNAVKYTNAGTVTVSAHDTGQGFVEFCVSDTGVGIPAAFREQVFSRFAKAESAETARHGTGLGLAIARSIVEMHGGRIWHRSQMGKGSSFFFTMPTG
ncbi:MAG: PAS domain-containing protein [Actinobacteria bacterium]|nr:PAS domain-containing protein [Actinomycetota bacterium]MBU2686857.1 PAS domain-containing protein [Actinomycetota bacterium]